MKAMVLAAGFGTRLKPWTDSHPKALVPVAGVPMLERVLKRLENELFDTVIVNVHHFAGQIFDFLNQYSSDMRIEISDESSEILDTGGGLLRAYETFCDDSSALLVHNVDILSDAPLEKIYKFHEESENDVTLLTSDRNSSRALVFDNGGMLRAWHDRKNMIYRPDDFIMDTGFHCSSFSGIYVVGKKAVEKMRDFSEQRQSDVFPIMDFLIWAKDQLKIGEIKMPDLNLIDIGKPDTLKRADVLGSKFV